MRQGRFAILDEILTLDPQRDHQRIVFLVGAYEYPWMMRKALEFALFRTYAVPSIGAILDQSQQFTQHGQKRYDDTALLIAEFVENGYDSACGRAAIRRMNQMHRHWPISNSDYLYVLSTFIYVPIDWHRRFGWRQPTAPENEANFHFWVEVGRRMGIKDIPPTLDAFEAFHRAYERDHFRYNPASRRVADATIAIFLNWYPALLRPFLREVLYTLLDDPLRAAFGYPRPHAALTALTHGVLKLAALVIRWLLPPRRQPFLLTAQTNRTYPTGYQIESLGQTAPDPASAAATPRRSG